MQRGRHRVRFWFEIAAAVVTVLLAVATIALPTWAEVLLGIDPDSGQGWFEVAVTAACGLFALAAALLASNEWRRKPLPA